MPVKKESSKRERKYTRYALAEIRFLKRNVAGRSYAELTDLFNRQFGLRGKKKRTVSQIGGTLNRYGLSNGRDGRFRPGQTPFNKGKKGIHPSRETEFRKGNRPFNWRPVGSERINVNGYVEVKIRNPKKWKAKHRVIWEKTRGKIPRGSVIIFADGNKLNLALNNLLMVSRSELAVMNHLGLISPHGELTRAGKSIADIKLLIAERKREMKKSKSARGRPRKGGKA